MGTRKLLVLRQTEKSGLEQLAVWALAPVFSAEPWLAPKRLTRGLKLDAVNAPKVLLCFLAMLTTLSLVSTAFGNDTVDQRADGCVVMDTDQAHADGDRLDWTFEIKHSGSLTFQLITSLDEADADLSATVEVDGKPHVGTWKKAHLIEDGLVWQCSQPIEPAKTGTHTLKVQSGISLKVARLIPTTYVKSKIPVSSSAYYDQWIAMYQSPEKQATLARFRQARFGMFIHWGVYSEAAGSWAVISR